MIETNLLLFIPRGFWLTQSVKLPLFLLVKHHLTETSSRFQEMLTSPEATPNQMQRGQIPKQKLTREKINLNRSFKTKQTNKQKNTPSLRPLPPNNTLKKHIQTNSKHFVVCQNRLHKTEEKNRWRDRYIFESESIRIKNKSIALK